MRRLTKGLPWFIAAVLLVSYNNCTRVGFNSGPEQMKSLATVTGNPLTAAAQNLLAKSCQLVAKCHPEAVPSQCEEALLATAGIDYQLGLPKGSVVNFTQIIQAESTGALSANGSAASACLSAVDQLSCTDPQVKNAFDSTATQPFAGLVNLIPTTPGSCPNVFSAPIAQKEFFVSPLGSDGNDGSRENPWLTLSHAAEALTLGTEGTTVHVDPGTYTLPTRSPCAPSMSSSCGLWTAKSGTSQAPITFISDQRWAAKLVAPNSSITWYNSGNHVRVIGFDIAGTATSNFGILSEGSFGQIISNHIHNIPMTSGCATVNAGAGIFFGYFSNSTDNDAIGNLIHDIGPMPGNGLAQSSYCGSLPQGIAYSQPRGRVQNNIIYKAAAWGISTSNQASDLVITQNLVFNNGVVTNNGVLLGGGILISASANGSVHNNTTISNNIVRNNSGHSIAEWNFVGSQNAYYNNVDYLNGLNIKLIGGSAAPTGTVTGDPKMVSFDINGNGNYHLAAGSPAIDAGSMACAFGSSGCVPTTDADGFGRPFGSGVDIGPYEFH